MTRYKIPDVESAIVNFLLSKTSITDIVGSSGVSTIFPKEVSLPRLRINLAGGIPIVKRWLYGPRINVEAWAETKEEAFDLMAEAIYVLEHELVGAQIDEGVVTGCEQETGISWSPDQTSNYSRYFVGIVVYIHPKL